MSRRFYYVMALLLLGCGLDETGTAPDAMIADVTTDASFDVSGDVAPEAAPIDAPEESTGFDPTHVANLALWMRADKNVHLAANNVTGWDDSSGSSDPTKNAASTLAAPTFNATDPAYNSQPTLSFSAPLSQCLATSKWSTALSQPTTIFIVGNDDGDTVADRFFCDGTSSRNTVYTVAGSYTLLAGAVLDSKTNSNGTPVAIVAVFNGPSSAVYVSGATPKAIGQAGAQGIDMLWIGCEQTTKNPLNGKLAEIAVYAAVLGPSDISQLLGYAGSRYGVGIGP